MQAGQPTLIGSVQRALLLLDIIAAAGSPVPAKVLARTASLSMGTTYNLARTLLHEGYLAKEPDGYVLGPGFPALTGPSAGVVLAHGRAVLNGVRDQLRAAAYLTRYVDGEIELVDVVDGPFAPRVNLWVGVQDSAHATAFGKQILAALRAPDRLDYLSRHPPADLTRYTISDRSQLLRSLDQHPAVTADEQEYVLGFRCLAAPVLIGGAPGAIAVSLPADRMLSPGHQKYLVQSAQRLSLKWARAQPDVQYLK